MDEYGGPAVPPRPPKPAARVHRPAASARRPSTTADSAAPTTVSLLRPRPEAVREANAYVETPSRCSSANCPGWRMPSPPMPTGKRPVTTQPSPAEKRHAQSGDGDGGQMPDSIVCSECGRCRCEQCARPRQLPQRWLCGSCLCSCEAAVDYASCMCCVKAFLYHCGGGGNDDREEEVEPCGCGGGGGGGGGGGWRATGARLLCLAALALPLPCLVAYWPLRGCAACTQALYARATYNGCRCRHPPTHRHSSSII